MIALVGSPAEPAPRLVARLAERGVRPPGGAASGAESAATFVIGPGASDLGVDAWLAGDRSGATRILVLSLIGAHRDATVEALRRLWDLEERARATGLPVLTLRLGPLIGPRSPLWLRLRSRPRLARRAERRLLQPVLEDDVLETLARALSGAAAWEGWFEVVGEEALTLAELASLAKAASPPLPAGSGEWEPELAILERQRLGESDPWRRHFGVEPGRVSERTSAWAA